MTVHFIRSQTVLAEPKTEWNDFKQCDDHKVRYKKRCYLMISPYGILFSAWIGTRANLLLTVNNE